MNSGMSKYTGKTVPELLALGHNLVTILSSEAGSKFGVTPAVVTALGLADTNLDAAENAQKAAMIAAKGSTVTKLAHKDDVASRIAAIQATVTANPIVTDADLVSLGFPPRRSGSTRPKLPNPVTGLIATPDALGGVKIAWNRNDPRTSVSYIVEHSGDGGATWSLLDTTQRVSISASGFAPGVPAWFRVTATAAAGRATPSAAASIYAPVPAVELKLAA